MPALRTILATALIAAAVLSAAPARSATSPYGEMGVFAGERTNAGDWTGTWMYVWRDGRMALWLRPGKDGKPEARFQFQSTASPETFETDWSGKSTYYLSGEPATFELKLLKRDKDEILAHWDWNVDFVNSGRTERGDLKIYRVGDGRMLAFEFQPGYMKEIRRHDKVTKAEAVPLFNFVKASRRIVLWDELPW